MPTEAEWEYACKERGKNISYCKSIDKNFNYKNDNSETVSIRSYSPNSLGLYNMSGNVWEWTCSKYEHEFNGHDNVCIDKFYNDFTFLTLRGGSWKDNEKWIRSSSRLGVNPFTKKEYIGFRLLFEVK